MFECLEVAHEAVLLIGPIMRSIAPEDRNLSEQLTRATVSIVSNIDEGAAHVGRVRTHHYRLAFGSAREARSQLRVAVAWGYVESTVANAPLALLDRVCAMLWRLIR